jgi:hypothetical protein
VADHPETAAAAVEREPAADGEMRDRLVRAESAMTVKAGGVHAAVNSKAGSF